MPSKIINTVFDFLRGQVLTWLRKWVLDFLLKKILGTAITGVYGWIVTFFFGIVWKKYLVPLYKYAMRKAKTAAKRPIYKKKAKNLEEAQNEDEFNSGVDDLP